MTDGAATVERSHEDGTVVEIKLRGEEPKIGRVAEHLVMRFEEIEDWENE